MDIMELGAIGELVGGVAVIASLLYVGLQIRQNTRVMRGQAMAGLLVGQSSAETAFMGDDTASAFVAAMDAPAELTGQEIAKVWAYLNTVTLSGRQTYEMYSLGLATEDDRKAAALTVAQWLGFPFGRVWWKAAKSTYPSDFAAEIDAGLNCDPLYLHRQFEEIKEGARMLVQR